MTPLEKLTHEYTDLNMKYNIMNADWEIRCKKLETENHELVKLILALRKTVSEQTPKKESDDCQCDNC
jgi:hypothetical protein